MEYWSQTGWDDVAKCWKMWWPGTELNRRRQPFQGCALPPELPGHIFETRSSVAGCEDRSLHADCCGIATERKCSLPNTCGTFLIIATAVSSLNVGDRQNVMFDSWLVVDCAHLKY